MKKTYITFLLSIFLILNIFAQTKKINSGYISIHGGAYTVLSENYDKYYDSKFGTIFGASLGIPVCSKINLFAKLSYFENEAIPTSELTGVREGSAILKQVLFNGGMQYKMINTKRVNFYIQFGLTAAIIDEERKDENGAFTYEIEGNGNFGIFAGGIIEVNLGNSPFSMISEFNYIYSWSALLEYDDTYKAINFVAGLRYYLAR